MDERILGPFRVSALALGCMNVSWRGRAATDPTTRQTHAVAGIHSALDAGMTLLDTADVYAPSFDEVGHNEILVAEALESWTGTPEQKSRVVLATKGGVTRSAGEEWGRDSSAEHLLRAAEASRHRLGVEVIPLYQHHRLDWNIPFETQVENLRRVVDEGIARAIGVSNYSAKQLQVALEVVGGPEDGGIVSVQNPLSPFYFSGFDAVAVAAAHSLAFLAWGPLGGKKKISALAEGLLPEFSRLAREKGTSVPSLILAWLVHLSPAIIPVVGATRPETVADAVTSTSVRLNEDEVRQLTAHRGRDESPGYEVDSDPEPPWRDAR